MSFPNSTISNSQVDQNLLSCCQKQFICEFEHLTVLEQNCLFTLAPLNYNNHIFVLICKLIFNLYIISFTIV